MSMKHVGQKEIAILFTALIGAVYGFGIYLFPAMVESVRRDISFSYSTLGLISGTVQAGFLVSSALAGFLTLWFGATNLILFSIILSALALGGLTLVGNVYALGAFLLILGACASLIWVPMVEVSREIISPHNRGKALCLMSSGTSYGVFINSILLAAVLPVFGWRMLWATTFSIVTVLAIYSAWRLFPVRNQHDGPRGVTPIKKPLGWNRVASLPKKLVGGILVMMFLNGISCMSFQTYLSAYLVGQVGLKEVGVASVWGIIGVVGMFSGFLIGALADRITIRRGMIVTYLMLGMAALAVIFAETDGVGYLLILVSGMAFGLSFYAIFGLIPAYISHLFSDGNAALIFSFGNVFLGIGGVIGNLFGGYVKEKTGSFDILYLTILITALLSAVIATALPREVENDFSKSPYEKARGKL